MSVEKCTFLKLFSFIKNWYQMELYDKKRQFDPISALEMKSIFLNFLTNKIDNKSENEKEKT